MKKLLYIPAVLISLAALGSVVIVFLSILNGEDGTAALHVIFTFSDILVATVLFVIARD